MNLDENYIKNLLPKRPEDSNKGTFGSVLNIAGSKFYTGAAYFSSIAPLKVGCGKSTLAGTKTVLETVSVLSPDIILMPIDETKNGVISPKATKKLEKILNNYEVISIGCGLSTNKDTVKFFEKLIKILNQSQTPVVIDADGLNILSGLKNPVLPQNTILTPHPKELSRLMKIDVENILLESEFWVKKCCEKYNCTTVLKLHKTIVADNKDNFYVNNTGNSALSHGGSGDVLCGMISGFLAQGVNVSQYNLNLQNNSARGVSCFEASILSVYLHGLAAEMASKDLTEYSTLSSDLLEYIPRAIKSII